MSEQFVLREACFDVPAAITPGTELFHDPRSQASRRVVQPVRQSLRTGPLDQRICSLPLLPLLGRIEELLLAMRQTSRLFKKMEEGNIRQVNTKHRRRVATSQLFRYGASPVTS